MACPGTVNRCGLKHMKVDHDCRDFPQKSLEKCNTGDASLIQLFDLSKPSMVVHLKDLHIILFGPWCQYSYLVSNVMARWCHVHSVEKLDQASFVGLVHGSAYLVVSALNPRDDNKPCHIHITRSLHPPTSKARHQPSRQEEAEAPHRQEESIHVT